MNRNLLAVLLILLLSFSLACQDKAARAELDKFRAQAEAGERNKEVARNFFEAIDRNDFDKLKELASDDFFLQAPGLEKPWGLDGIIQAIKAHYTSFPDWTHRIEDMVAEGDKVAVRLAQNGTHKALYEGILPTGKKVTMPAQVLLVIVDGKVKEFWAIENYLDFFQQLGMELRPKEAKK